MQRRARLRRRLRRTEARVHVRHVPLPPRPRGPRVHGRVRALSTWMRGARRVRCGELQMRRWVRRGRLLGARPRAPPAALTLALRPSPHPRPTPQVPIVEAAGGGGASVHVGRRTLTYLRTYVRTTDYYASTWAGQCLIRRRALRSARIRPAVAGVTCLRLCCCRRDAREMRARCGRDAREMHARCARDAAEMRARYGRDAREIRPRCTPDMSSRSRACRWALRWEGARAVSTMSRPILSM